MYKTALFFALAQLALSSPINKRDPMDTTGMDTSNWNPQGIVDGQPAVAASSTSYAVTQPTGTTDPKQGAGGVCSEQKAKIQAGYSVNAGTPCDPITKPGICISNKGASTQKFYFFRNSGDGDGYAQPSNTVDEQYTTEVESNGHKFVELPAEYKGRIQRSPYMPATWNEFQIMDTLTSIDPATGQPRVPDCFAHGDISLIQGYDGAAEIARADGKGSEKTGFSKDILQGAQESVPNALVQRQGDGKTVIKQLEDSFVGAGAGSPEALNWVTSQMPKGDGNTPLAFYGHDTYTADFDSESNALLFTFY